MGSWSPEQIDQLNQRLSNLEQLVKALQGDKPAQVQAVRTFEETEPVQIIGDDIQTAYDVINTQIESLRQGNDPNASEKITSLISLKAEVPYHFSFGQKDQQWINDKLNSILNQYA